MNEIEALAKLLEELGLRALGRDLGAFIAKADQTHLTPQQIITELTRLERDDRAQRSLERRQKRSRIGHFKPIADFDWNWPRLDRALVHKALDLHFLNQRRNLILVGPHGLGKTMLLQNIAHQAVLQGHPTLFTHAARLLNDLACQETPRALERRLRHYAGISLLCIDELGYLSYDTRAADLLFEIVARRYGARKPIALTTNLAFADWNTVFPNATCTVALVDRLTHHADILRFEGKSWRNKEAKQEGAEGTRFPSGESPPRGEAEPDPGGSDPRGS